MFVCFQSAGNAVKRATEALVREAQSGKEWTYEENEVTVDQRMVSGMAQVPYTIIPYTYIHTYIHTYVRMYVLVALT